jgi:hypothetical protein
MFRRSGSRCVAQMVCWPQAIWWTGTQVLECCRYSGRTISKCSRTRDLSDKNDCRYSLSCNASRFSNLEVV